MCPYPLSQALYRGVPQLDYRACDPGNPAYSESKGTNRQSSRCQLGMLAQWSF